MRHPGRPARRYLGLCPVVARQMARTAASRAGSRSPPERQTSLTSPKEALENLAGAVVPRSTRAASAGKLRPELGEQVVHHGVV